MIPVVHLVGYSDSGKTTVTAGLVKILKNRGYRVGAVKHAAHGYEADCPGSDSWHFAENGADQVGIIGPESYSVHVYRTNPNLSDVLSMVKNVDLVLVEGYKDSPNPKIEVYRQGYSEGKLSSDEYHLAIVSDTKINGGVPNFSFGDLDLLADLIIERIITKE